VLSFENRAAVGGGGFIRSGAARRKAAMTVTKISIAAALALALTANAQAGAQKQITCTGVLVDVWLNSKAMWPLGVIYDATNNYTCSVDRLNSGHEPLKPCNVGEQCRVTGIASQLGNPVFGNPTYVIQQSISVERP
jgi:hypothetical protein